MQIIICVFVIVLGSRLFDDDKCSWSLVKGDLYFSTSLYGIVIQPFFLRQLYT